MKKTTNYTTDSGDRFSIELSQTSLSILADEGNGNCISITLEKKELDEFISLLKEEGDKIKYFSRDSK